MMLLFNLALLLLKFVNTQSLANSILNSINQKRTLNGLPMLKSIPNLENAAKDQALYMCENSTLTHDNPNGDLQQRVKRNNFLGNEIGENIAKNHNDKYEEVVNMWLNSAPHRKNIFKDYVYTGLATCVDKRGSRFWVQVFGKDGGDLDQVSNKKDQSKDTSNTLPGDNLNKKSVKRKNELTGVNNEDNMPSQKESKVSPKQKQQLESSNENGTLSNEDTTISQKKRREASQEENELSTTEQKANKPRFNKNNKTKQTLNEDNELSTPEQKLNKPRLDENKLKMQEDAELSTTEQKFSKPRAKKNSKTKQALEEDDELSTTKQRTVKPRAKRVKQEFSEDNELSAPEQMISKPGINRMKQQPIDMIKYIPELEAELERIKSSRKKRLIDSSPDAEFESVAPGRRKRSVESFPEVELDMQSSIKMQPLISTQIIYIVSTVNAPAMSQNASSNFKELPRSEFPKTYEVPKSIKSYEIQQPSNISMTASSLETITITKSIISTVSEKISTVFKTPIDNIITVTKTKRIPETSISTVTKTIEDEESFIEPETSTLTITRTVEVTKARISKAETTKREKDKKRRKRNTVLNPIGEVETIKHKTPAAKSKHTTSEIELPKTVESSEYEESGMETPMTKTKQKSKPAEQFEFDESDIATSRPITKTKRKPKDSSLSEFEESEIASTSLAPETKTKRNPQKAETIASTQSEVQHSTIKPKKAKNKTVESSEYSDIEPAKSSRKNVKNPKRKQRDRKKESSLKKLKRELKAEESAESEPMNNSNRTEDPSEYNENGPVNKSIVNRKKKAKSAAEPKEKEFSKPKNKPKTVENAFSSEEESEIETKPNKKLRTSTTANKVSEKALENGLQLPQTTISLENLLANSDFGFSFNIKPKEQKKVKSKEIV